MGRQASSQSPKRNIPVTGAGFLTDLPARGRQILSFRERIPALLDGVHNISGQAGLTRNAAPGRGVSIPSQVHGLYRKNGEPAGIRTQDPMIKSHVLYRLSYRLGAPFQSVADPSGVDCAAQALIRLGATLRGIDRGHCVRLSPGVSVAGIAHREGELLA